MDNAVDLPGYKYYVDPRTGERPALFVAFVNVVEDPAATVSGVAFPVAPDELPALDARERNYQRRRVGREMWAYVGSRAARERFDRGLESGTVVVDAGYLRLVRAAFPDAPAPELPVRELRRVDL